MVETSAAMISHTKKILEKIISGELPRSQGPKMGARHLPAKMPVSHQQHPPLAPGPALWRDVCRAEGHSEELWWPGYRASSLAGARIRHFTWCWPRASGMGEIRARYREWVCWWLTVGAIYQPVWKYFNILIIHLDLLVCISWVGALGRRMWMDLLE